jgi:MYXO-CTERM domain-containing protein
MLVLALLTTAQAGDVFIAVGDEVQFELAGTWARIHPSEEGWWYFAGAGGEYWADTLNEDLTGFNTNERIKLTDNGRLQDTQVERCSDGDWLVLGSATIDTFDDSAYSWRWDAGFTTVEKVTVEERVEERAHNDMAIVCDEVATGVSYTNGRMGTSSTFFEIGPTSVTDTHEIEIFSMGGSFSVRESDGRIIAADIEGPTSPEVRITVFNPDWSIEERTSFAVPAFEAFWPQRLMPFNDGWIITWLARDPDAADTEGEVWVGALDADFQLIDSIQVSPEGTTNGRPWVTRRGDVLAVSYDRLVQPYATLVYLDGATVPPDDDGLPDTGPSGDDDTGSDTAGDLDGDGEGCGCTSSGGAGAAALFAGTLLAGAGRRRRDPRG